MPEKLPADFAEMLRGDPASHALDRLHRRLLKAKQAGAGLQFSADDIDWLTITGGYASILQAVADQAFDRSSARLAAKGLDVSSFPRPTVQTRRDEQVDTATGADGGPEPKTGKSRQTRRGKE